MRPSYGNCITEEVTEMPRSFSSAIQSEVAWRAALRPLTEPAIWIAPPNSSSFSVSVVLPASGCEMIAKVRRRAASVGTSDMGDGAGRRWVGQEAGNYTGRRRRGPGVAARHARTGSVAQPGMRQGAQAADAERLQDQAGDQRGGAERR